MKGKRASGSRGGNGKGCRRFATLEEEKTMLEKELESVNKAIATQKEQ
jgi:hypothetical protein